MVQSPPSPTTLLSAEEAKERLREIVERFFFRRRRGDQEQPPPRQLLVRSPPGLGKTKEAMEWAIRYQTEQAGKESILELSRSDITAAGVRAQVAIFVPRHELAQEVKAVIERNREDLGAPVEVPVLPGRDHEADKGNGPCRRWREARELGRKGLPVYSNLCRRRHQRAVSECPYFADCEYIRAWHRAYDAPYVILVHSHLGVGWESTGIVRGAGGFSDSDDEEEPQFEQSFNPANAAIVVCDEDPTTSLIERSRIRREDIGAIAEGRLGEHILAGLSTSGGLLDHLREQGITPEQLRQTASGLREQEQKRGQVATPGVSDTVLEKAVSSAVALVRVSRVLERLADELASGRPGPAYSLLADGEGLVTQGRRPWPFDRRRLLVLDGTANPEILGQFVPSLATVPEIRVQRNAHVIQVRDLTFFRHSLVEKAPAGEDGKKWRPTARLAEVAQFITEVAQTGRTLVVTNKRVRCALTGESANGRLRVSGQYAGVDVAHFGNIRGTNEFEDHEIVIVLGREQSSPRDAERLAKAIWYDTKQPIQCIPADKRGQVQYPENRRPYNMHDGGRDAVKVKVHPDRRVRAVVEQIREAEMVQAIDRLRLIHSPRKKTVIILCNIPLDIPVDELVTWRELTGDGRLAQALEACEENGWEALPLAAKELTRLFPGLWATERAAEDWAGNNPLNPDISTIRLWGVIHRYRPIGRRGRWSKAVVRHGADPRMALAGVLGVSAGDIRVRDGSE